jgi:hypothetical protein
MKRRDLNALVGGAALVPPAALAVAVLLFAVPLGVLRAASPVVDAAQGDFAGLIDIGVVAACTWSAGARAVRWSCLKLATAAPPGSGTRTTSRERHG